VSRTWPPLLLMLLAPAVAGFSPLSWIDPAAGENRAGNQKYRAGAFEDAAKSYSKGAAADPGRPELLYNLGNALERLNKHPEAAAAYQQALQKAPASLSAQAWYNLGNSLLAAGKGKEAVQAYRESLVRDPSSADAKRNLELALEQAKKEPPKSDKNKNDNDKNKDKDKDKDDKDKNQGSSKNSEDQKNPQQDQPKDQNPEQQSSDSKKQDQDADQQTAKNEPNDQKPPEQPPPSSPPPQEDEKPAPKEEPEPQPSDSDLTKEQAENLLRSFDQMERRQREQAEAHKDQQGSSGGLDW